MILLCPLLCYYLFKLLFMRDFPKKANHRSDSSGREGQDRSQLGEAQPEDRKIADIQKYCAEVNCLPGGIAPVEHGVTYRELGGDFLERLEPERLTLNWFNVWRNSAIKLPPNQKRTPLEGYFQGRAMAWKTNE